MSNWHFSQKFTAIALPALQELDSFSEPGESLAQAVIEIYLETAPDQVRAISSALGTGDFRTIHAQAHALKSSSANLGALQVSALSRDLELRTEPGLAPELNDLFQVFARLEADFQAAQTDLQTLKDLLAAGPKNQAA